MKWVEVAGETEACQKDHIRGEKKTCEKVLCCMSQKWGDFPVVCDCVAR